MLPSSSSQASIRFLFVNGGEPSEFFTRLANPVEQGLRRHPGRAGDRHDRDPRRRLLRALPGHHPHQALTTARRLALSPPRLGIRILDRTTVSEAAMADPTPAGPAPAGP